MAKKNGRGPRPSPEDQARVPYPAVRDRLLTASQDSEYVEWLIEVGRYVEKCWLAEEQVRKPGADLDEDATKELWDRCTEGELRTLRTEGLVELEVYRQRKIATDITEGITNLSWGWRAGGWFVRTMVEGFVAGIGLIVLGLLFVWLAPHVVKSIRGAMDDALPAATSPRSESGAQAPVSNATRPTQEAK